MLDKIARWTCARGSHRLAAKHPDPAERARRWRLWRGFVLAGAWLSAVLAPAYASFGVWLFLATLPYAGQPAYPGSPQSLIFAACVIFLFGPGFVLLSALGFRLRRISGQWPQEDTPAA